VLSSNGALMAGSYLRLPSTGAAANIPPLPTPSPSSSKIVATRRKSRNRVADFSVPCRIECCSSFLANRPSSLYRSRSLEIGYGDRKTKQTLRRASSADLQVFDEDDEFVKKLEELALGGNPGVSNRKNYNIEVMLESVPSTSSQSGPSAPTTSQPWQVSGFGPSISIPQGGITSICDMPASLRMLKQKKKQLPEWEEGFWEVGESARCSVNKAFSSMVFMIRELQSYALYMRQGLFYEDIQDILGRVQQDMHASFVWLFQQIFSCTPTLMVSVMLLLANFTVYSLTNSVAFAAPLSQPQISLVAVVESNSEQKTNQLLFDQASAVKNFSPGKTASVGGRGSGGGKVRPVAGSTDDGRSGGPSSARQITHSGSPSTVAGDGAVEVVREEDEEAAWNHMVEEAKQMQVGFRDELLMDPDGGDGAVEVVREEDEEAAWNHMVEEAKQMQVGFRDEMLMDPDVLKWLVNPVKVEVETDAYTDYQKTELHYQLAVQQDPQNSLLLTNFAQFLQLVLHDNER
jgi:hypothetical protein